MRSDFDLDNALMMLTYTTPRTVAKISVPDRHDWAQVADWIAAQMGLKVADADPVFDEIMQERRQKAERERLKARKK